MNITERLWEMQDSVYADFQARLTPGILRENCIGVRVPLLRKLAKELYGKAEAEALLKALPHRYYDEDMLHGLLIAQRKDYSACINDLNAFLPYVNNWAVCDTISPSVFKKHRPELFEQIRIWTQSSETYTIRFGIEMIQSHFLDEDFRDEALEIPANIRSEEYYVRMMQAWFFATALAKQWEKTIPYLEGYRLEAWTHNKTIQKARESFRITNEQKTYLNTLKITNVSRKKSFISA